MLLRLGRGLRRLEERLRARALTRLGWHTWFMRRSWNELHDRRGAGAMSFLKPGAAGWDEREFQLVGERFVGRMVARFVEYGATDLSRQSVVEIGCGIGRFLRPLSQQFAR